MTKNEMNYDEQQHQVVRGRDDIKVGDLVMYRWDFFCEELVKGEVESIENGFFFRKYVVGNRNGYYKKYRWQLFKINS